jgi:hypothetical protein
MNRRLETIQVLQKRLQGLQSEQRLIDARRRALQSRQARKADTRRKILAGAILLAKVDQGVVSRATFLEWLDRALTRADDRRLFDLN